MDRTIVGRLRDVEARKPARMVLSNKSAASRVQQKRPDLRAQIQNHERLPFHDQNSSTGGRKLKNVSVGRVHLFLLGRVPGSIRLDD